jgi:hypothetical protein
LRDDFLKGTREKLAQRAGYRCSKPGCRISTRGADSTEDGTIDLGHAAHITAASPGGPRYDPSLTSDQRKHISNALWLCANHAKLVDSDESHFTVEELRRWKRDAEDESFNEVSSGMPLVKNGEAVTSDISTAFEFLRRIAAADLATFRQTPAWPSHAVELNLKLVSKKVSHAFGVRGLASVIDSFDEIAVIAQPGTGKTTTLLQLAVVLLEANSLIPCYVPLSEWATQTEPLFHSLLRRKSYRAAKIEHLELLSEHGKLLLVLDGWNELDEAARSRIRSDLKKLQRESPDIRLIVSSRYTELDLPVSGPLVQLDLLTHEQQQEIARSLRGSDGDSLLDHAWRTPGLRELVGIPLYLSVLLKQAPGASLPTTKEELLRAFVVEHESASDKAALLKNELHGAIGAEAMQLETTALTEGQARATVNLAQDSLLQRRQISQPFPANRVLDVLANAHLLVRGGDASESVGFQHHQFQEWFASLWAEELILSFFRGSADDKKVLRQRVLNIRFWEEAILFACERLSHRDDTGVNAIAAVLLETLGIDPLLSAEIVFRSSVKVWEIVKDTIVDFAVRWHTDKEVDRAVQFMINTGRPEFAGNIWPLISNPNDQIHLSALRAGRRFRTGVLGSNPGPRISALPEELRSHVLSEIAGEGGMDGIELATRLAMADTSPKVQTSVIDALQFRRADRFVTELMTSSRAEVWPAIAEHWDAGEFADAEVRKRIRALQENRAQQQKTPERSLERILKHRTNDPAAGQEIRDLVASLDFSKKTQDPAWIVERASEIFPNDVAAGLIPHLEAGERLPYRSEDLLRNSNIEIDDGPLVERLLQSKAKDEAAGAAASVVGTKTIGLLGAQIVEVDLRLAQASDGERQTLSQEHYRLAGIISNARGEALAKAILARSAAINPHEIATLANLISRHGKNHDRPALVLGDATHAALADIVRIWGDTLIGSGDSTRAQLAEIAGAAERLGSPVLFPVLKRLLAEDLARRDKARCEMAKGGRRRRIPNDISMIFLGEYAKAFAAIGDEPSVTLMISYLPHLEFGIEAAQVLRAIWKKSQPADEEREFHRPSPDFSGVRDQRALRQSGTPKETAPFALQMFSVARRLSADDAQEVQMHAINLASVGFCMPYFDQNGLIESLLQLPLPPKNKQRLLTVLALSGETIPSQLILEGVNELLTEANANPWLLQEQESWRLMDWLRLFPFTEKPLAVIAVLDRLEDRYKVPWEQRPLLSALGYSPSEDSVIALAEMVRRDRRLLNEHDWLSALANQGTLAAANTLLDLVCDGSLLEKDGKIDRTHVGRSFATFIANDSGFRREVYSRFIGLTDNDAIAVVGYAIAEVADPEGVLVLVRSAAARNTSMQSTSLYSALRNVLIGKRPSEMAAGSHELVGLPAADLRKRIFDLFISGTPAESAVASECLIQIDNIRDDYGSVDSEPRHPDITTGLPWPSLSGRPEIQCNLGESTDSSVPLNEEEAAEILPENIEQFSAMRDVRVKDALEWQNVMRDLPEAHVKEVFAGLLREPTKKDWGGEQNDHFSANIVANGRRNTAAFLLKGPTNFREMTLEMCGKRGDQLYRLANSDADIFVVQHAHLIGDAVRGTLRALTSRAHGRTRRFCVIDGMATYRILKAYGKIIPDKQNA